MSSGRSRRLGLLCITVIAQLLASVPADAGTRHSSPVDRARVIPDSEGAIAEIVLHYLPDMEDEIEPFYRDLFAKLPEDIRIQIICPSQAAVDQFLATWEPAAASRHRQLQLVAVDRDITIWSRDRRIARHRAHSYRPASDFIPVDSADCEEEKRNEILMASDLIQVHFVSRQMASPLHLEGGNIVSNSRHVFVGANAVDDNADLGFEEQRLTRELSRVLGLDPIVVLNQGDDVPFCHVDMYLTPLDDHTMLVACPGEGLSLLLERDSSHDSSSIPDWLLDGVDDSSETAARFDAAASQISDLGYRVIRVPAVVDRSVGWMITYNNVLIDRRRGRSTVYMPVYRIPALDRTAAAIYSDLGFDVRTVDVSRIYNLGGAVRCIVNVTRRKPPGTHHTMRVSRPRGNAEPDDLTDIEDQHRRTTPQDESKLVRLRNSGGGLKRQ